MSKIFLDIGAHRLQTLLIGIEKYPDYDSFIGVEPVLQLINQGISLIPQQYRSKTILCNMAVDALNVHNKEVDFYEDLTPGNHHLGSSLFADKTMRKNKKITVQCIDIKYLFDKYFKDGDEVVLKLDVEGAEYRILDKLMNCNYLTKYVKKLWIEWHYDPKVPSISKKDHLKMVKRVQDKGFDITGISKKDELYNLF